MAIPDGSMRVRAGQLPEGMRVHGRKLRLPPFALYAIRRLALFPAQLILLLFVLYMIVYEPYYLYTQQNTGPTALFTGFAQMVVNDFTGNWGISYFQQFVYLPLFQLYSWALPGSVELAVFAFGMSVAVAYPVSILVGWTRRPRADVAVHFLGQVAALLPAMLVGTAVVFAIFFWWTGHFAGDLPDGGIIPTGPWWLKNYAGYPSWIVYDNFTQPTGMPLVDGLIHHAWAFEEIVLLKTLIQAGIIAIIYVSIFLRHAHTVVVAASQEPHVVAARARGVPESTLQWRHAGRRVRPTFLLTLAVTFPAYLGTQFVVEAAFADLGLGNLALLTLTGQGLPGPFLPFGNQSPSNAVFLELQGLQVLMFILGLFVLVWLLAVDLLAKHFDPRSVPRL